jgi:hypothetical protein
MQVFFRLLMAAKRLPISAAMYSALQKGAVLPVLTVRYSPAQS